METNIWGGSEYGVQRFFFFGVVTEREREIKAVISSLTFVTIYIRHMAL